MTAAKVAISLPPELLRLIDVECRARGISRSEYIRSAIAYLHRSRAELAADAEYEDGYAKYPEDPSESEAYLAMTSAALSTLPWDE